MQREWLENDYYEMLGVSKDASQKDITSAYRRLARQLHPDANPGDAKSEERFKEISSAYDVIGDPESRAEYDQIRSMSGFGPGGPGPGFGTAGAPGFGADIGDLLGNLFGRGEAFQGGSGGPFSRGPQRGTDLEADLHLAFMDAFRGVTTSVNLISDAVCTDCVGTGAAKGTTPRVCPDCSGRGVLSDDQGFFSFSRPCATCGGRGNFIDSPCPSCSGSGVNKRPRVVKVRLPEGVRDGQQIRLKGKGGPGRNNGPAGDLYVRVHVDPHAVFGRDGDNLTVTVPITFPEAALGADIKVPTVEGDAVAIRLPPATNSGKVFRIRNRGAPTPTGRGDLLVTVELVVPQSLSSTERAALETLRDEATGSPRSHLGV